MIRQVSAWAWTTLIAVTPVFAQAGPCDATYSFDGSLADSSGNGYDGQMIAGEGTAATPQFAAGRSGQALRLDGSSAMRAFLDLHPDTCPQVTISAWINVESITDNQSQYVFSTGNGGSPGLRIAGTNLQMAGRANGIYARNVSLAGAGWTFVSLVYDYAKGEYRFYWRNREEIKAIGGEAVVPKEALWVGAFDDRMSGAAKNLLVDDLRIAGRALDAAEIAALRNAVPGTGGSVAASSPDVGGACTSDAQCPSGSYCAVDGTCHPQSHLPMGTSSGGLASLQEQLAARNAGQISGMQYDSPTGIFDNASGGGTTLTDLQGQLAEQNAERVGDLGVTSPTSILPSGTGSGGASEPAGGNSPSTEPEPDVFAVAYDGSILVHSGVSGERGDYTERRVFTDRQQLLHHLQTREDNDKPCRVFIDSSRPAHGLVSAVYGQSGRAEIDVCDEGLPRIGFGLFNLTAPDDAGLFRAVTALQVCTPPENSRVKGIRAQVRDISYPNATYGSSYQTLVMDEKYACSRWQALVSCPANSYAVGVTLHFLDGTPLSPKDYLSGIALVCSQVSWVPAPP